MFAVAAEWLPEANPNRSLKSEEPTPASIGGRWAKGE
jgi:hypothetical protein